MDLFTPEIMRSAMESQDTSLRGVIRAAVRRSLYIMVKCVACYDQRPNLMTDEVYRESCDYIQWGVVTKKRLLVEDPRAHIKTYRTSIGIPLWCAVQHANEEYDHPSEIDRASEFMLKNPHLKGADSRLVIASDSKDRAKAFVGASKTHWETNPFIRWLFPEFLWPNFNRLPYGQWQATGYTLNGRVNKTLPDPYLRAVGLDSKEQGGRADGIIIDDIVGETSVRSDTEISRRRSWVRSIGNILESSDYESPRGGFIMVVENRWGLDDVNSMIHTELKDWAIWRRSAFRCYVHGTGNCGRWASDETKDCAPTNEPLWKEVYEDAEALAKVRADKGEEIFASQWLNDPTTVADLDPTLFKDFTVEPRSYMASDSTTGETRLNRGWCAVITRREDSKNPEVIPLDALSYHVISIDPASSREPSAARTALSWFAMDRPTGRVFWLDCRADRWSPDEATVAAFELYKDAASKLERPPKVLIEKVAAQGYFASALKFFALRNGIRMSDPEMIPPAYGFAKEDRIKRRVGNRLNQGLLYLRGGLELPRAEARHFPTGTKDTLDTLVQAEEVFLQNQGGETVGSARVRAGARRRARARRLRASSSAGIPI